MFKRILLVQKRDFFPKKVAIDTHPNSFKSDYVEYYYYARKHWKGNPTGIKSDFLTNKEKYENLKNTIADMKADCGEICDLTSNNYAKPGEIFDELKKSVNCTALFKNSNIDGPSQFQEPPKRIPKWLVGEFTYGGQVPVTLSYYSENLALTSNIYMHWKNEVLESMVKKIRDGTYTGISKYQRLIFELIVTMHYAPDTFKM